jgi:hypothetical protein
VAHPPELLMALLNHAPYGELAAALNHTVSLQSRDLARLPMLVLLAAERDVLVGAAAAAVSAERQGNTAAVAAAQVRIDAVVASAFARPSPRHCRTDPVPRPRCPCGRPSTTRPVDLRAQTPARLPCRTSWLPDGAVPGGS